MKTRKTYTVIFMLSLYAINATCGGVARWTVVDKNLMAKEMMQITRRFQHMKNYEVQVTHATYESYTSTVPHQISKGYFKRVNKNYHNFLLGIHTIQNNGCRLVIDSAKKVMMIADPTEAMDSIMPVSNYTMLYGLCSSIKEEKEGDKTIYRFEFDKKYTVSAMEFTLQDSLPSKIVMYYRKEVKVGSIMVKPRLEIEYTNWKLRVPDVNDAFNTQEYLTKNGNKYVIKTPYRAGYKLLDERVLTRNDKK